MVSVPPHTVDVPLGTVSPVGKVSVKATPVRFVPLLALVTVNVSVEVPLSGIEEGLNPLLMLGGPTGTGAVTDPPVILGTSCHHTAKAGVACVTLRR